MTQEEILQYNKLCAEFLGFKYHECSEYWTTLLWGGNGFTLRQMHFHSDWNWIMEVVEAIVKKIGVKAVDECSENEWYATIGVTRLGITSKKEAVVQAINKFLIWYNENKTN